MKRKDRIGKSFKKRLSFRKAQRKAKTIQTDKARVQKLLTQVTHKVQHSVLPKEKAQEMKGYLQTLSRMVKAYYKGDYRAIQVKSLLVILAGLLYFVAPLDMIPDFIPVSGLLDDFTVLLWVVQQIREEIEAFQQWELLGKIEE